MKKIIAEFKEFALRGNVMDLAVGVIIGGAFQSIVTALTDNLIAPLLSLIGGGEVKGLAITFANGSVLDFGAFISAVIHFLIMAVVLFALVKVMNSLTRLGKGKEEPAAPTTKKCPYCQSEIDIAATKCPHCTSDLSE